MPQTIGRLFTPLPTIYLVSFFYTLHVALPVYANSSFLSTIISEKYVGLIFGAASLLTIVALILIPRFLKIVGDYHATLFFIILEILALLLIALSDSSPLVIALFILSSTLITLIYFDFDLIVERYSRDANTGSIRGLYLTSANIAWVIAPSAAAVILAGGEYWKMYLIAAALFIPGLLIFAARLEKFKDPLYRKIRFQESIKAVYQNRDLRNIFGASFLLQFFFNIMVIYTPIYLHRVVGFSWGELGPIFSIMLIPFLILEAPLGRIADKYLGEKELLVTGFAVIAIATGAIYFFTIKSFALFSFLLFSTRVGAAMVEVMTETYFFKKISAGDAAIVSLNRTVRPFAGLVAPLSATALFTFIDLPSLFIYLAVFMLLGIPISLAIRDTR